MRGAAAIRNPERRAPKTRPDRPRRYGVGNISCAVCGSQAGAGGSVGTARRWRSARGGGSSVPRSRLPSAGAATSSSCFSSFAAARRHLYLLPGTARRLRSCRGHVFFCGGRDGAVSATVVASATATAAAPSSSLLIYFRGGAAASLPALPLSCRPLPSRRRGGSSATARCQRQRRPDSADVSSAVARAQVAQVSLRSPDAAPHARRRCVCAARWRGRRLAAPSTRCQPDVTTATIGALRSSRQLA